MEELLDNVSNEPDIETSSISSVEEISNNNGNDDQNSQHNNQNHGNTQNMVQIVNNIETNNEPILLKIDQINIDINFPWKIWAFVGFKHPKRIYNNANGPGEISTWDLVDDTGSINLVAFNLNSHMLSNRLIQGKTYEFSRLSIRTVDSVYKNLSHLYQIIATNSTHIQESTMNFNYQLTYNFTHLNEIESSPLNSLIDIQVQVLRDYGTTTGYTNDNSWSRRELHVVQDGEQIRLTLWNDQAKQVVTSMVNMQIKLKNVKISWFNGSRNLVSLANTQLVIV